MVSWWKERKGAVGFIVLMLAITGALLAGGNWFAGESNRERFGIADPVATVKQTADYSPGILTQPRVDRLVKHFRKIGMLGEHSLRADGVDHCFKKVMANMTYTDMVDVMAVTKSRNYYWRDEALTFSWDNHGRWLESTLPLKIIKVKVDETAKAPTIRLRLALYVFDDIRTAMEENDLSVYFEGNDSFKDDKEPCIESAEVRISSRDLKNEPNLPYPSKS